MNDHENIVSEIREGGVDVCDDVDNGSGIKCMDDSAINTESWCDQCKIEGLLDAYDTMKLDMERGRPPPLEGEGIPADDCDGCSGTGSLKVWVFCEDCLGTGKGAADD